MMCNYQLRKDDVLLLTFRDAQGHVVHSTLHQLKIHFLSLKVCFDYWKILIVLEGLRFKLLGNKLYNIWWLSSFREFIK